MSNKKPIITAGLLICLFVSLWPGVASSQTARHLFFKAETCYKNLRNNPSKIKYRENWQRCIEAFETVYRINPNGPWAAAALYKCGELYQELYRYSYKAADIKESLDIFERICKRYPKSSYKPRAEAKIREILRAQAKKPPVTPKRAALEKAPVSTNQAARSGDDIAAVIEQSVPHQNGQSDDVSFSNNDNATVTDLRFWSNPNYTRIVIDADNETTYNHRLLNEDPTIQKPQRLYVDLNNSQLGKDTSKVVPINDNLLSNARAGQYTLDTVRVVVDIKSFKTYKIFSLKNPFRIVIDIWGETDILRDLDKQTGQVAVKNQKIPAGALAKQLALGVRRIVIDPAHGGRDYGAPGYLRGVHEKNVVLSIAKKLAAKVKQELGCEVVMTREGDQYLTLEERTAIANTENADLFISIHTNSARDRRANGIETYFLNLATDDESIRVAATENATSAKNISDLQTILNDLMQNAKVNESSRLAAHVQEVLYGEMKQKYNGVKNKGVKQAPFYVLLGAQMPSILIETSFISHPEECRRLIDASYQDALADGIVKGIRSYIRETTPTAFSDPTRPDNARG